MKWVTGGLFVLTVSSGSGIAAAENAGSAPPTAQFPPADGTPPSQPAPAVAPAKPPAASPTVAPPPAAAAPVAPPVEPPPPESGDLVSDSDGVGATLTDDSPQTFSLTFSPLHLIAPILQLTGELRVVPHFGISVIAGYGELGVDAFDSNGIRESVKVNVYELGARTVGYPLKNFKSLQLGAQLLYIHVDTKDLSNVSGSAAGAAVGPFIGYKLITQAGFTFLAQGGFQYLAARADAHDSSGNTAADTDSRFLPLLNLDVGWSF